MRDFWDLLNWMWKIYIMVILFMLFGAFYPVPIWMMLSVIIMGIVCCILLYIYGLIKCVMEIKKSYKKK